MTRERQRAPMMSSVVEYSRLRFSLFSPVSSSTACAPSPLRAQSRENTAASSSAEPPSSSVSLRPYLPSSHPPYLEGSPDSAIARGRVERYNVPRTRSILPPRRYTLPVYTGYADAGLDLLGNPAARERAIFFFFFLSSTLFYALLLLPRSYLASSPSSPHLAPLSPIIPPSSLLFLSSSLLLILLLFRGRRRGYSCLRLSAAGNRRCFSFTRGYPDVRT